MALNSEEIIKALECLWYEKECMGDECPLFELGGDCAPLIAMNALALIKELTEEKERLSSRNKFLEIEYKNQGNLFLARVHDAEEGIKAENERLMRKKTDSGGTSASDLFRDGNLGIKTL